MNRNHRIGDKVVIIDERGNYLRFSAKASELKTSAKTVSGRITAIEPIMAKVSRDHWIAVRDEASGWQFAAPSSNVWRVE